MVRAILRDENPKTQTRRIVKPMPINTPAGPNFDGLWSDTVDPVVRYFACPYGCPGDRLWVRESYVRGPNGPVYSADLSANEAGLIWENGFRQTPSIFMRRWESRLSLDVVRVRVERLRDISEADAKAEGADVMMQTKDGQWVICGPRLGSYREGYRWLWDSINAKPKPVLGEDGKVSHYISFPWAGNPLGGTRRHRGKPWYFYPNPWVWVVEFKRV